MVQDIEGFVHYFDVLEECLQKIAFDPCLIFGVDEVGIQFADRTIKLVTGREYFNKMLQKTSIHTTLTLCTSPGNHGIFMPPHFLFQQPEDQAPKNLLTGTTNAMSDYSKSRYQDEKTILTWLSLFVMWKTEYLEKIGYPQLTPMILFLDGYYFHLDINFLYTAAMNHITVICMLAHLTHLFQSNDKTFNKTVKKNLDL